MSAHAWVIGLVCASLGIVGCSSGKHSGAIASSDAGPDAAQPPESSGSGGARATDDDTDTSDTNVSDASAVHARASDAGMSEAAASDADSHEQDDLAARCALTSDDPDDNFADTNCDGIDGDKRKAVFVTKTGVDSAPGTFEQPVATLGHAIALAAISGKDVYACGGVYRESIALESKAVRVFGGYDCSRGWVRNTDSPVRLISRAGTALSIKNTSLPIVFDRVDIESPDATKLGDSSVAVFVANSSNVTLRRGTYRAGDGAVAEPPADMPATPGSSVVPRQGNNASKAQQCGKLLEQHASCSTLVLLGLSFADPTGNTWNAQQTPIDAMYCPAGDYSFGGGGGGTDSADCYSIGSGTQGYPAATSGTLNGLSGSDAPEVSGASLGYGTLDSNGYSASNQGQPGKPGAVGQGGTGGRGGGVYLLAPSCDVCILSEPVPIAGGGQGGPGGCGGNGGVAGNAGGASIAVAIFKSNVTLDRATLQSSKGGGGSRGGLGSNGAPGVKGAPAGMVNFCNIIGTDPSDTHIPQDGGNGGDGGRGSQGGPGGGGPSLPLFVLGLAPTLTNVTFLPGSGGLGGSNGGVRAADGLATDTKLIQ